MKFIVDLPAIEDMGNPRIYAEFEADPDADIEELVRVFKLALHAHTFNPLTIELVTVKENPYAQL